MVRRLWAMAMVAGLVLLPGYALALGGTVQYPDGSPAAGAFVKVKAEGNDYAQVKLPASIFGSGNVAIVLPAKNQQAK